MKTIIAGSRTATMQDVMDAVEFSNWFPEITEIVSGCARGADKCGEKIAQQAGIPLKRFPADWNTHGKAAGPIRNQQMAEYADALILAWDGQSPGSKNMLEVAQKAGLQVYVRVFVPRGSPEPASAATATPAPTMSNTAITTPCASQTPTGTATDTTNEPGRMACMPGVVR